jgi:uncharacterized protein (DUF1800 family)
MDRRTTLRKFIGAEAKKSNVNKYQEDALPVSGGLTPYSGTWDYATAAHLLRRAMFGPTHEQITKAVSEGLQATLAQLLVPMTQGKLPAPPVVYYDTPVDPNVAKGSSWVTTPLNQQIQGNVNFKEASLYAWLMEQMFNEGVSLVEKMTLFWHNHFVVSNIYDPRMNYDYITLLRLNSLGNFKELASQITIDKSMLIYLNGNTNNKNAPNENYARELMELFTLGKGALAGPGDYTTFTEQDVAALAKALTGWFVYTNRMDPTVYPEARFNANSHDTSTKQLSHRFNNEVIVTTGSGADRGKTEYQAVVDIIFKKREAATFICRKLYRYFIYYKVDASIENEIVEGLGDILIANNFEISSVLEVLLGSSHFYSEEALGCMIRPPYEFVFNTLKTMKFSPATALSDKYNTFLTFYRDTMGMQQVYFDVPSVAGWTPYYQEPAYHEIWVNSVTFPLRVGFTSGFANKTVRIRNVQGLVGLDLIKYVSGFSDPGNANQLIDDIVTHLLPQPIYANQKAFLKSRLLGPNTDTQWTTAWNNYVSNPNNQNKTNVETRLKPLFVSLLSMPEYYLS